MNTRITVLSILCPLILLFSLPGCKNGNISSDVILNPNTANGKTDLSQLPAFKFDEVVHDFGKVVQGEAVSYSFKFTNTGKTDLLISDVSTSCGCTVPSYPKNPIRPSQQGVIKVSFNSTGKHGFQEKNIVVVANTQPNTYILKIKAEVSMEGRR